MDDYKKELITKVVFPNRKIILQKGQKIQEAVNSLSQLGGGKLIIPPGTWKTEAIHLKSNICLELEEGAVLSFSDKPEDYLPVVLTRWEGTECYNYSPLIYAKDCENIGIIGKGILQGNGENWWPWKKLQQEAAKELCYAESEHIPVEKRIYGTKSAALRPSFIQPFNCKNILIAGIKIINGPQWTVHPVYCENVEIKNITIDTNGPNTDGLNPDSCKNIWIHGCDFSTGDDCIAINSGINEDGLRVNQPSENILIEDCMMAKGHGAITIGSAMSGGVKNIVARNCHISHCEQGIRLKSMRGRGGYIKNVTMENIEINEASKEAIQINMFYESSTVIPKTQLAPQCQEVSLKNIYGKNAQLALQVKGLPEQPLEKISLENIHLTGKEAMLMENVKNIKLLNVILEK